jgi:hypothetical protein
MRVPLPGNHSKPHFPTHLFLLRVWREELGDDQHEWRASARHVISGETRSIRTWHDLETFIDMISSQQVVAEEGQRKEGVQFPEEGYPGKILTPNGEAKK